MKRKHSDSVQIHENNTIKNYFSKKFEKVTQTSFHRSNKVNVESDSLLNFKYENGNEFYPGYLTNNFDKMLNEIFNHKNDANLFTKNEIEIINLYKNLSNESKKLILKFYGRQWKWQRNEKDLDANSLTNFQTLLTCGFITNDLSEVNLKDKLNLMLVEEIEKLAKKFNIKSPSRKKSDLVESIIKASNHKNIISNFMTLISTKNSLISKIELEINKILKSTYKICSSVRNTFCKITIIFSITDRNWDDCSNIGEKNQKQLYFLLQIERGEIILPLYKLSRVSNIFECGISLDNYVTALEYSLKLRHFLENHKLVEAHEIYNCVLKQFNKDLLINENKFDKNLSNFLKQFTLKSLLIRIYSLAVTLLEKRREYSEAVDLLKTLIAATKSSVGSKSRGKWYFRLCVNYQSHLKNQNESIFWLEEALKDNSIPEYFKLTFKNRFDKLKKDYNCKQILDFEESIDGFSMISMQNIQIKSQKLIEAPRRYDIIDNHRPRYVWKDLNGEIHCHVEDYVIYHCIDKEGYMKGIHGETGTFIIYFLLLFYDIIYADVPDVFYTWRQIVPLDMYSTSFKSNRIQLIEKKIDWLTNQASTNDIDSLLSNNWKMHFNELGLVANWKLIDNEDDLIGLFNCLGIELVLKICEKFLENFNFWSSGMPDLVLWNSINKTYEIIEVKGPGDKLSDKQKLWIMELQEMNANVSMCQVEGICYKKL